MSSRSQAETATWTRALFWVLALVLFVAPSLKVFHVHVAHSGDAGHTHALHHHSDCVADHEERGQEDGEDESEDTRDACELCLLLASLGHGGPLVGVSLPLHDAICVDRHLSLATQRPARDPHALAQPRAPPVV